MSLKRPAWWNARTPIAWLWLPLAAVFLMVSALRRRLYLGGFCKREKLPVPVIIVGNLAAGGSGKTPVVVWLVSVLRTHGFQPGILSRGYGGAALVPEAVPPDSDPVQVGDEPVMLARRTGCPLWIGRDRAEAGRQLLKASPEVNVLITDDGLQHYRLERDAEIVVLNERIIGNGWPMPAGPMREPLSRLAGVAMVVANGPLSDAMRQALPGPAPVLMQLVPGLFYRLDDVAERCPATAFAGRRVHALAGIADPQRFFDSLRAMGLAPLTCRAFGDHHAFREEDLAVPEGDVLLLTEKDAVKCAALAPADCWVLPVDAQIDDAALKPILERLHGSQAA